MSASDLYSEGRLDEAVQAQVQVVKQKPADADARGFLAELLCFAGDLDRADKQLDVISNQSPELALGVSLFRQLVRAEMWRRDFFQQGRAPELLADPTPTLTRRIEASILLREGDASAAQALLQSAEEERRPAHVRVNGQKVDDWRDCDDLIGDVLEVLSSTGKYFWVPYENVVQLELHAPERPRDLLWRRASFVVRDGPEGEVFLPAVYPAPPGVTIAADARLGRSTDWVGGDDAPVRGVGQRTFIVGSEPLTAMQLETVEAVG
jgi:type VI secretion system protein ImpE